MIKKAVILAGGLSERMNGYADSVIKCLLPIGNETILGRTIKMLKKNGVEDIVLIIGYKAEEVKKEFGDSVRYVEEPFYTKEGMLDSLHYAAHEFNEPCLFSYADSVFNEDVLKKIIESEKKDVVCLLSKKKVDEEAEKIRFIDSKIIECSKEIPIDKADSQFTGMIKLSEKGSEIVRETLNSLKESDEIEYKNVRDLITIMANNGNSIPFEEVEADDWMEIDFLHEYEFAKKQFVTQ